MLQNFVKIFNKLLHLLDMNDRVKKKHLLLVSRFQFEKHIVIELLSGKGGGENLCLIKIGWIT